MDTSIEELSPEKLKSIGDQEVYDRMAYLQEIEDAINTEREKCKDRLGIKPKRVIPEKCPVPSCGSRNLEPKKNGGYLCKKCGYRHMGLV